MSTYKQVVVSEHEYMSPDGEDLTMKGDPTFSRLTLFLIVCFLGACSSKGTYYNKPLSEVGQLAPQLEQSIAPLKLLIIGGSSGIGFELTKLALSRKHQVTVVSRNPARMLYAHPNLVKRKGDITEYASMNRLIPNHDVVISAIGLPAGTPDVTLFSEGIKVVINVMQKQMVDRLISVTAVGAGDSKDHGGFWFDRVLQPFILASDIADKTRQEKLILKSGLNYTIVRPALLNDESASYSYRVIQNYDGIEAGEIARSDVAHFILASIEQELYGKSIVLLSN